MPKRKPTHRAQPNAEHRRRVYAACSECRRRRRKCDGSQPCTQCDAYGYACAYDTENGSAQSSLADPNPSRQSETRRPSRATSAGAGEAQAPATAVIVSRERGRIVHAHSAVALPRLVGQTLALDPPPRLHSYAWNLGLRAERRGSVPSPALPELMTLAECQSLCAVYFVAVHPLFAFLHQEAFLNRLAHSWGSLDSQPNLSAVVALVAALGSFFSLPTSTHPREREVALHGVSILDLGLSSPAAAIDMDAVAGWILRAIYMRLTTRPAISCLASHTAMHFGEVMGLHRDPADGSSASGVGGNSKTAFSDVDLETRRRYFCVARFLNRLLATEYGLSNVSPRHTNCVAPAPVPGTYIEALHSMSGVLADADVAAGVGLDSDDFAELFRGLQDFPHNTDDTVALFAADICLCLLRRFTAASRKPGPRIVGIAAGILRRALDAVAGLLAAERTWWNMLSVPFQSVCVFVSLDDSGLLELLPTAMELLRGMADKFASHMAKEALATAQQVITASRGCTEEKLGLKDAALAHALPAIDIDWSSFDSGFDMGGEWPSVVDFFM